jgi:putative two-component system response regulator
MNAEDVNTTDPATEVTRHLRGLESRGSHALVAQLVNSLVGESSEQMNALRKAISSGDRQALYRAAHSLQGSAAIVGASSVARACSELVRFARHALPDQIQPLVEQIDAGFAAIRKALAGWSKETGRGEQEPAVAGKSSALPFSARKRVLVVDDDDEIRKITKHLVEDLGHEVETARDGLEGLAKLRLGIDLVLLDVVMPGLDGFEVCRRIRQSPAGKAIPVIIVTTLETKEHRLLAVEAGASDFIAKPIEATELRVRSASLLKMKEAQDEVKRYQVHLEDMCDARTESLRKALEQMADAQRLAYTAQLETVERLAMLAEYKDKVTGRHIVRMSEYCAVIARGLGLPAEEVELVLHASRMHDVGKIAMPEAILRKPSSLDSEEWTVMRRHSEIGGAILDNSTSQILQAGRIIALNHHERWDGNGYPKGLSGSDIPLWGRICAVADVFDAVTSERPYKPAFPNEEALELLRAGRGKHFDPRVVDVFFASLDEILEIQEKFKDD